MRPIQGYEGLYAATTEGQIWSYRSKRFLSPYSNEKGYLLVDLYDREGKVKHYKVHRLICETFIPNPENKPQVNHISEVKSDNRVSNLEWATSKENNNHGTRTARVAKKLSKPVYCVELDMVFESRVAAAAYVGVQASNICACLKGRVKTCGRYHWREYNETSKSK